MNAENENTTPRTEDFTIKELLPIENYLTLDYGAYFCNECGSLVNDMEKHVTWHNKLLP